MARRCEKSGNKIYGLVPASKAEMDAFLDSVPTDADGTNPEHCRLPTHQPIRNGADPAAGSDELKHHFRRFDIAVMARAAVSGHEELREHIQPLRRNWIGEECFLQEIRRLGMLSIGHRMIGRHGKHQFIVEHWNILDARRLDRVRRDQDVDLISCEGSYATKANDVVSSRSTSGQSTR